MASTSAGLGGVAGLLSTRVLLTDRYPIGAVVGPSLGLGALREAIGCPLCRRGG